MLCVFRGPSLSVFRPVLERSFNDRQGYIGIHGGLYRAPRGEDQGEEACNGGGGAGVMGNRSQKTIKSKRHFRSLFLLHSTRHPPLVRSDCVEPGTPWTRDTDYFRRERLPRLRFRLNRPGRG